MATSLPFLAFNDVYRVQQRYVPQPGAPKDVSFPPEAEIRVGQFGALVHALRAQWATRPDGAQDGLVLFAGDVFSPSVESSVTRGSHMVPILNALKLDCACVGNHDFDFGYPHLTKLAGDTAFPWLLSNVVDTDTGKTPAPLQRFSVIERCGVRVGVVGLVEEDWIATIPSWPTHFRYRDMKEVAIELSKELRDPNGEHKVDIIIALTHCRVPNDLKLASELGAVSDRDCSNEHGVDLIIGGHDHIYYIGKGAASWDGYVGLRDKPGTREDTGARVIKSGTDFRDLSEAVLELSAPNPNAVRRRIVTALKGKHHYVLPSSPSSPEIDGLVEKLLASVTRTLARSVCYTLTSFDARSEVVRTQESSLGNWVADVLLHAYDESLVEGNDVEFEKGDARPREEGGADAVIICGGTLRGDSQYGPGKITLGDILEIFPFDDPVVCIDIDGKGIWDTLESALSRWPAQEGRFPIVAGLAVEWDHHKPPGSRINSIHLTVPSKEHDEEESNLVNFVDNDDGTRIEIKKPDLRLGEAVKNEEGGRIYRVITRQYMADGFDGFEALKGRKFVIDDENGQTMSSIIRSFLLGSAYIFRHKQLQDAREQHLSTKTLKVLNRARARHQSSPMSSVASSPRKSLHDFMGSPPTSPGIEQEGDLSFSALSNNWQQVRRHIVEHDWVTIREAMHVAKNEHMSIVDRCEGDKLRQGKFGGASAAPSVVPSTTASGVQTPRAPPSMLVDERRKAELRELSSDVAIVSPQIDGRLHDVGEEAA